MASDNILGKMQLAVRVCYWTGPLPELLDCVRCCWRREASWLDFMPMPGHRVDSLATWVFWLWLGTIFSSRWCYELASLPWRGSDVQQALHDLLLRNWVMQEYALNSLCRPHHWFCSVDAESNRFAILSSATVCRAIGGLDSFLCVLCLGFLFR